MNKIITKRLFGAFVEKDNLKKMITLFEVIEHNAFNKNKQRKLETHKDVKAFINLVSNMEMSEVQAICNQKITQNFCDNCGLVNNGTQHFIFFVPNLVLCPKCEENIYQLDTMRLADKIRKQLNGKSLENLISDKVVLDAEVERLSSTAISELRSVGKTSLFEEKTILDY